MVCAACVHIFFNRGRERRGEVGLSYVSGNVNEGILFVLIIMPSYSVTLADVLSPSEMAAVNSRGCDGVAGLPVC